MEVESAIRLINDEVVFFPGWKFTATDHTNRFEGSIKVRIDYHAHATERAEAPEYKREIDTYATFPMVVLDCSLEDIFRRLLWAIGEVSMHEAREALRVRSTLWAPFHPHRIDGMRRWGSEMSDLQFGIA